MTYKLDKFITSYSIEWAQFSYVKKCKIKLKLTLYLKDKNAAMYEKFVIFRIIRSNLVCLARSPQPSHNN